MTGRQRREFAALTGCIFLVGVFLYGGVAALLMLRGDIGLPGLIGVALGGGYVLFSVLSGLLVVGRWLSGLPFGKKLLAAVFFPVPLWLVLAGVFYSVPYGIYNLTQLRRASRPGREAEAERRKDEPHG